MDGESESAVQQERNPEGEVTSVSETHEARGIEPHLRK